MRGWLAVCLPGRVTGGLRDDTIPKSLPCASPSLIGGLLSPRKGRGIGTDSPDKNRRNANAEHCSLFFDGDEEAERNKDSLWWPVDGRRTVPFSRTLNFRQQG